MLEVQCTAPYGTSLACKLQTDRGMEGKGGAVREGDPATGGGEGKGRKKGSPLRGKRCPGASSCWGINAGKIASPRVNSRRCLDHNTKTTSSMWLLGTGHSGRETPAANLIGAFSLILNG